MEIANLKESPQRGYYAVGPLANVMCTHYLVRKQFETNELSLSSNWQGQILAGDKAFEPSYY